MSQPIEEMDAIDVLREIDKLVPLGDAIYDVRSRAVEDEEWGPWEGDSWDHPMVQRYGELAERAGQLIRGE